MKNSGLSPRLEAELAAVASGVSCDLVHVEFKAGVLKLILDRPQGVTLADCEVVSKQASAILDVDDFGAQRYVLEVSSPGLDRQLYRPQDYERFVGHRVRVTFVGSPGEGKRTIYGRLHAFQPDSGGRAVILDSESGDQYTIPLANIKLARLEIEL